MHVVYNVSESASCIHIREVYQIRAMPDGTPAIFIIIVMLLLANTWNTLQTVLSTGLIQQLKINIALPTGHLRTWNHKAANKASQTAKQRCKLEAYIGIDGYQKNAKCCEAGIQLEV